MATPEATPEIAAPATSAALKVARLLGELEAGNRTSSSTQGANFDGVTESPVQWLLHRRMNAQQQMRWTPRGVHLMLKVRCAVMNGTLERNDAVAETSAYRPFRRVA
jgi:hypothetical protein